MSTKTLIPDNTTSSSEHSLSRRAMLGGLAGAVVVGWLPSERAWAGPNTPPNDAMARVPDIDGTMTMQDPGNFSVDFGAMVEARPSAVLQTDRAQDIAKIIRWAKKYRIPVAMNGQSGEPGLLESHSNYGQALTAGGVQIDARRLNKIHSISASEAVVGAGVTWAELADAATEVGGRVPALTDYLHLSIGGTVSVGGIGGTVHKYGLQSDLVSAVEVVTGEGNVVVASHARNRELFGLVLAGAGQFGIITKVKVKLVPARSLASVATLFYQDIATFVVDARSAMKNGEFDHQNGYMVRNQTGDGWDFSIEVGFYHDGTSTPDFDSVLSGMSDDRSRRQVVSMGYKEWALRVDPFADQVIAAGNWEREKPWLSLLVPEDAVVGFLAEFSRTITPRDVGMGFCVVSPMNNATVKSPMFQLPGRSDGVTFFIDLLCFPGEGDVGGDEGLKRNRKLYDRLVSLGGKRYIIGAIPDMTRDDWRTHFGSRSYSRLCVLKDKYDPAGILTPGQRIF